MGIPTGCPCPVEITAIGPCGLCRELVSAQAFALVVGQEHERDSDERDNCGEDQELSDGQASGPLRIIESHEITPRTLCASLQRLATSPACIPHFEGSRSLETI